MNRCSLFTGENHCSLVALPLARASMGWLHPSLELPPVDFGLWRMGHLEQVGVMQSNLSALCPWLLWMSAWVRLTDQKGAGKMDKKADLHVVRRPEKKEVIPKSTWFWEGYCKLWQWWEPFPADRLGAMNYFPTDLMVTWSENSALVFSAKSLKAKP